MAQRAQRGFSIRIFLQDGSSDGLRTIEKSNWTGRAIVFPRARFKEARTHESLARPGVYVLVGPSEEGDLPKLYVGQGDPVRPRLESHFANKDFWTLGAVFTSKDENLNKAHIEYLEARLIGLAKEAKRGVLDNSNVPHPPSVSQADEADMETFLEEMLRIYPVIGISVFERPTSTPAADRLLHVKAKGIGARGYESDQGFVVVAGSEAVFKEVPSLQAWLSDMRTALTKQGILALHGKQLRFTQDYAFGSPSTAAAVVLARNANGRIEWKDKAGKTLRQIQTEAAAEEAE